MLPAADQDENEDLVGASEAAQILGYGSTDSFISALGHGLLPDLEQPDGVPIPPRQCRSAAPAALETLPP
ncbi:hypothetical protein ACWD4T_06640 [Streptomyces umbrinus]